MVLQREISAAKQMAVQKDRFAAERLVQRIRVQTFRDGVITVLVFFFAGDIILVHNGFLLFLVIKKAACFCRRYLFFNKESIKIKMVFSCVFLS